MTQQLRRWLILLAVAIQIGAVAFMALSREWVLRTGQELIVQTAPVDPRDIFRGDFVRLGYLFARLRPGQVDPVLREQGLARGQRVYLAMEWDHNQVAVARRLQAERPPFPFLPGRVRKDWQPAVSGAQPIQPLEVDYGIDRYFVEQGKGREMELTRGSRDGFQRAMLIHLAVPDSGQALIRGHEWADVSVKTELVQSPPRDAPDEQASNRIRLSLRNESQRPLVLMMKPDGCSFDLLPTARAPADAEDLLERRRAECADKPAKAQRIEPGSVLDLDFDFNRPQWWVEQAGRRQPLGRLPGSYRWRLVYLGPLPKGWRGRIVSRAFHAGGTVD